MGSDLDAKETKCIIHANSNSPSEQQTFRVIPYGASPSRPSSQEPLLGTTVPIASPDTTSAPKALSGGACFAWLPCRAVAHLGTCIIIAVKLVWIIIALLVYSLLLMPGFLRMVYYYFLSDNVVRGILYGGKSRQRLDLYYPANAAHGAVFPVVIYVTGGAWTIGYKAWGALLARRLSEQGVLVACLDYRNFPQGDVLDMLEDVNTGISWVLNRIDRYGGDPDNITLVGQSAGGHLAGLALIKQAEQAALGSPVLGAAPSWSPAGLRAFVGVSGAFDLEALAEHRGGVFRRLLDRILAVEAFDKVVAVGQAGGEVQGGRGEAVGEGQGDDGSDGCGGLQVPQPRVTQREREGDLEQGEYAGLGDGRGREGAGGSGAAPPPPPPPPSRPRRQGIGGRRPAYEALSPLSAVRRLPSGAAAMMPYTLLIHGTADKTVPAEGSARLCEALTSAGAPHCRCVLVSGKTHTAFLLEDPMRGGRDLLSDTVLGTVTGAGDSENHVYGTLCPGILCDLAGWVSPF